MTIESKITKRSDDRNEHLLENERKIFTEDMYKFGISLINESKQHMQSLKDAFHDEVQLVIELIQERPTRDEVRSIAQEEIYEGLRAVNAKLDYLNEERKQMLEAIGDIKA